MSIDYSCRLEDPYGRHLKTFSNFVDPTDGGGAGLDYVLNVNEEAAFLLTVPATENLSLFEVDCRFRPMRAIHGRQPYNDNGACYLLRKKTITRGWYRFTASHMNGILTRRVVAYDSKSVFATKTDNVGDLIKTFTSENMGTGIDVSRDTILSSANLVTPGYLVIDNNIGDGVSVTRDTARGQLLRIFQDLCDDSTQSGTYMSFGITGGQNRKPFTLETRAGQWGEDRRNSVILSSDSGNIENWKIEIDYSDEASVIIAAGDGQGDERIIQVATDPERIAASPFGHIERMIDAPNSDSAAKVLSFAQAALRQAGTKITFEADLMETPKATRGVHFDLGDIVTGRVTVEGNVVEFPCRLDTILVSVRSGNQRSRVQLKSPI